MNTGRTHFKKGHVPYNKGGHLSDEIKKKISISKSGKPSWNKGKKLSGSHRKALSNAKIGLRGEKTNNWKGGTSRSYKTGYWSSEYKQWRVAVFIRDNFRCVNCGFTGGYLTAHHIKSWKNYPELRFAIDNGVTLCEECHSLTDNYKGRNAGTKNIKY